MPFDALTWWTHDRPPATYGGANRSCVHGRALVSLQSVRSGLRQTPHAVLAACSGEDQAIPMLDPLARGLDADAETVIGAKVRAIAIAPAGGGYHPTHSRLLELLEQVTQEGSVRCVYVVQPDPLPERGRLEVSSPETFDELLRHFPRLHFHFGGMLHAYESLFRLMHRSSWLTTNVAGALGKPRLLDVVLERATEEGLGQRLYFASGFPNLDPTTALEQLLGHNVWRRERGLPSLPSALLRGIADRGNPVDYEPGTETGRTGSGPKA